ncbi:cilia- and flagella-associated protein 52 [Pycnococcus provasolii]
MATPLPLESVIGFGGAVTDGLILHPDGQTLIYPLGSMVVVRPKNDSSQQEFLQGHTDEVSCIAISKSGRYLASGQITYLGFTADIIVWDLELRRPIHKLSLHQVKVTALDFSFDDRFLASMGGEDDNSLVIWDVQSGKAICGHPTDSDHTLNLKFLNRTSSKLVTGGKYNINVWDFNRQARKLKSQSVGLGNLKRSFSSLAISKYDEYAYCGTTSGDVLQIALLDKPLMKQMGPSAPVAKGVTAITITPNGDLLVGGGDGSLVVIEDPVRNVKMRTACQCNIGAKVTSLQVAATAASGAFAAIAGTDRCDMFDILCDGSKLGASVFQTCHFSSVNDVCFPIGYGEVFATCSSDNIRIWHLTECRELMRIVVPNLDCHCICFSSDGTAILSGWSDGKIRAFGPQTGRLLFTINDAHPRGVTAIASTSDSGRIISGGDNGTVRVWRVGKDSTSMLASMKEHGVVVNDIAMRRNDSQCTTASSDGSCVTWDLSTYKRTTSLYGSTFFKGVVYHPDESQIVTCGTDRKVSYWDAYDGQAIRILDGSTTHPVNAIDIAPDGTGYVTGGGDKLVKLWGYDDGHMYNVGSGHSGAIKKVRISPDQKKIVSVGSEGAIFIWDYVNLEEGTAEAA